MLRLSPPLIVSALMVLALAGSAAAQPFSASAREDRRFGGASGTLVIGASAIEFRSENVPDAQAWPYEAIRVLRIDARDQLTIETYESRGWIALKHGHRRLTYRLAAGLPIEAVDFLLRRVARPMVTRVMPSLPDTAHWILPARHEQLGDDAAGTLELYDEGLAFRGANPEHTWFWRFRDLASVLPLDPFRIEVAARDADQVKPFTFQLVAPLPSGFRDAIWNRIHSPMRSTQESARTTRGVR